MDPTERFDEKYENLVDQLTTHDIHSDAFTTGVKNLRVFSETRPPQREPEPTPDPVPTTGWEKFKAGATAVWDNETTRVLIKAGGSLAGVGLVVWTTINRDHVLAREPLAQANQRN